MLLAFAAASPKVAPVQLAVPQGPRDFAAELLPRQAVSSLDHCLGLWLPRGRGWHFSVLNCRRPHSYTLPTSLWMAALLSNTLAFPPSLVSSANLTRVTLPRSLIKLLNQTGHRLGPCSSLLCYCGPGRVRAINCYLQANHLANFCPSKLCN